MSESAIFREHEAEYCELSAAISRKAGGVPSLAGEDRKQRMVEIETDIAEAEALLRRMDLEARSLPPAAKTPLLGKLRDYKEDLNRVKREVKSSASASASASHEARRDALLSRAELGGIDSGSGSQRERLLDATERSRQTSDRIAQGKRTLLETEEIGVSVLQTLHGQRAQIVNARDTLHDADDHIGKSRRLLSVMARRAVMNKVILAGVILMLLGCIIAVLYFKLK
mmetsp:Transcript_8409/g.27933  ORF Transcript_8409/g.27933 Transcript_8409/m.27933 type:complete len:227 (+) Transcript_8409:266-946(+)